MAIPASNEGFHGLEEFVCEAIHAPGVTVADPVRQGVSEGVFAAQEFILDVSGGQRPALDDAVKSEVARLAALVLSSPDPAGTAALVQTLLRDELAGVARPAGGADSGR